MSKDFRQFANYPRGLRNNNPGNISIGDNWIGKIGDDGRFVIFSNIDYGNRALAIDLANKINEGYDTITKIITRYAPPSENDTNAYIEAVSSSSGIPKDQVVTADAATLAKIMRGIIDHENGSDYGKLITIDDINAGIGMIPKSIMDRVKDFFMSVPAMATGAGFGWLIPVVIVAFIAIILISYYKPLKK